MELLSMKSLEGKEVKIDANEYLRLLKARNELAALEAAGVDNWIGYGEHHQFREDELTLVKKVESKVIRIW
jgi:hypothetical protein